MGLVPEAAAGLGARLLGTGLDGSAALGAVLVAGAAAIGAGSWTTGAAFSGSGLPSRLAVCGVSYGFSLVAGLTGRPSRVVSCSFGRFSSSGLADARSGWVVVLGSPALGSSALACSVSGFCFGAGSAPPAPRT